VIAAAIHRAMENCEGIEAEGLTTRACAALRLARGQITMGKMWNLANPTVFLALAQRALPWLAATTTALFAIGLWLSFAAPPDYQQGETVRIMYLHVPAAWMATFVYGVMTLAALGTLVWRHPMADAAQKAAAPLGAGFTFICLATGSLWGKPMWGTYWVWDARLTSVLILFLLYLGLIALWRTIDDAGRAARAAAILTLVGCVNLPIIKFSVDWWNTLHQPASVFRLGGPAIAPQLLWPLLVMSLAFTLLFVTLHIMAIRNEILRRRVARLSMIAAARGDRLAAELATAGMRP
jgi:heme exporter protein C